LAGAADVAVESGGFGPRYERATTGRAAASKMPRMVGSHQSLTKRLLAKVLDFFGRFFARPVTLMEAGYSHDLTRQGSSHPGGARG
jgi:hypothetical protein